MRSTKYHDKNSLVSRLSRPGPILLLLALATLAVLPLFLPIYWMGIAIYTLWIVYLCLAWNILASSDTHSLMHSVFIGGGAYLSTFLFLHFGVTPWIGMVAGAVLSAALSVGLGWLCFRNNLPLLAFFVVTIAFAYIAMFVVESVTALGGHQGLSILIRRDNPWQFAWLGKTPYYYIILVMVVGIMIFSFWMFRSKLGIYLKAIGANPRIAAAMGVDVTGYKLKALAISAAFSALAGTFWAQYATYIDPPSIMGPLIIMNVLLFVNIGGAGTLWGPVLAPVVLVPLGEYLRSKFTQPGLAGISTVLWAVVILAMIFGFRKGLLFWILDRIRKRKRSSPGQDPASAAEVAKSGRQADI